VSVCARACVLAYTHTHTRTRTHTYLSGRGAERRGRACVRTPITHTHTFQGGVLRSRSHAGAGTWAHRLTASTLALTTSEAANTNLACRSRYQVLVCVQHCLSLSLSLSLSHTHTHTQSGMQESIPGISVCTTHTHVLSLTRARAHTHAHQATLLWPRMVSGTSWRSLSTKRRSGMQGTVGLFPLSWVSLSSILGLL